MPASLLRSYVVRPMLAAGILIMGCGGPSRGLPDYSELLVAGVEPAEEADRVAAHLTGAGFLEASRTDVGGVVALAFVRPEDGLHAIRVVSARGVAVALDAAPAPTSREATAAMRGRLVVDPRSGGDLDADGQLDILVVRHETERSCWLVLQVGDDREVRALEVDAADLDPGSCLEDLRDANGDGTIEAIVGVRAPNLARTRTPVAELPLERDEAGIFRRVPPAIAFVSAETARLDAALAGCRAAADADACYTLAVERALLMRACGRAVEAQLAAFDEAVATTVWPEALIEPVAEARSRIALGLW